jgi:ribosome-associated protein
MMEANQDLRLARGQIIPGRELAWDFGPSGGPGGQHANRAHSRVELRFDVIESSAFGPKDKARLAGKLSSRLRGGKVVVVVDESRSQWRNRQIARGRMKGLLDEALRPDPPPRRPTKPSRAARRRRVEGKRQRSETKRLRGRPEIE